MLHQATFGNRSMVTSHRVLYAAEVCCMWLPPRCCSATRHDTPKPENEKDIIAKLTRPRYFTLGHQHIFSRPYVTFPACRCFGRCIPPWGPKRDTGKRWSVRSRETTPGFPTRRQPPPSTFSLTQFHIALPTSAVNPLKSSTRQASALRRLPADPPPSSNDRSTPDSMSSMQRPKGTYLALFLIAELLALPSTHQNHNTTGSLFRTPASL